MNIHVKLFSLGTKSGSVRRLNRSYVYCKTRYQMIGLKTFTVWDDSCVREISWDLQYYQNSEKAGCLIRVLSQWRPTIANVGREPLFRWTLKWCLLLTYVRKASHKPPGGLFILSPFEGGGGGGGGKKEGLILEGSLFNLEKAMVSVLHKN